MGNFLLTVIVVLIFLAVGPLVALWSLNTLFPSLGIAYTFWNWLAMFFLIAIFSPATSRDNDD